MPVKSLPAADAARGEGVIRYRLDFSRGRALRWPDYPRLESWRRILRRLGMIGRAPARYGGLAFGNVSQRVPGGFVISATQTGGRERLAPEDYCLVTAAEIEANRIVACGVHPPSSEALTHAAVYRAAPQVTAVFHGHSPEIWRCGEALGLGLTPPTAGYGTPALARAVMAQVRRRPQAGVIVMAGHEDGILAYGISLSRAGTLLTTVLARALTLEIGGER
ncbi:L-ribulose-5-phosphate 4-epimerase [Methylomarinovum caldicuralii]|uniref:L-ribulose-5-phosphate 4-epimerase n=1 Tax=Methylomarinovum caldicuralii TaxID=438856 RepID=A0AAU9C8E7_9GAMM|nr:class II aldolase/adducin family protein [Methylomarinovum caldicuralii]BCX82304.1 L-ribulose-5-phosphate 4-epimerase [Methylomarinovum caldicuralii]